MPVLDTHPPSAPASPTGPGLGELFLLFLRLGAMSFGGGMTAWTRREVVERRGWIEDRQFLSGVALSQIAPGANGVNVAVFVGTVLRGGQGALVALAGMMAVPVLAVLAAGWVYVNLDALPKGDWFGLLLAGIGAGAIGLNMASGIRMFRRNIRRPGAALVVLATAAGLGFGIKLTWVLAVMIPASLIVERLERPKA